MILVLLALSCAPPAVPARTWRGEEVAAQKESYIALDDEPWNECSPPGDEDLILRMMQTFVYLGLTELGGPGPPFELQLYVTGVSTIHSYFSPFSSSSYSQRGAMEAGLSLTYWARVSDISDWQVENVYNHGSPWPTPNVYSIGVKHSFEGPVALVGQTHGFGRPGEWDDPEATVEFYPFQNCISRVRPDRFQGTFWFDVSATDYSGPHAPFPVYMAWNASDGWYDNYSRTKVFVEYNFASSSSYSNSMGPRAVQELQPWYSDDLTEADLFPSLHEED